MAHISIGSGVKFFILRPAISCTFCIRGTCQVVLRLKNSKKLCDGKKKVHDGKEVLYMQKVDVYMEDELVPHIYVKDANISDVMMDKEEEKMKDEPESILNVTSCNDFLSIIFILILLYGLFSKWKIRGQPTKKQLRRHFHYVHNKKTLKTSHSLYDEVATHNPQSPSILTSHKLVRSNAGAKLVEGNGNQKFEWEVVSYRKRNFNYWYGPIKPGDLYSDS